MEKRILLLADTASSHTEKWALGMAQRGFTIGLFSLNKTNFNWYRNNNNIILLNEPPAFVDSHFLINKLKYLLVLPKLRRKIKEFRPQVLHAHYASSYGLLAALSGFRPFIISTWGSDVFEFPKKSFVQRHILKYNLNKASKILATSYALKGELWNYTQHDVQVIPFGVNTELFYPQPSGTENEAEITIGTIKAMEHIYGIPIILKAIPIIKKSLPGKALKFLFVGGGSRLEEYRRLTIAMGLEKEVVFTGKVPFRAIPHYHNLLHIFLNVSTVNESFGVSVIEAMACQKPVVVTDAQGLREIVNDDPGLAIIIKKQNHGQLAEAIIKLIVSPQLRLNMGLAARRHVLANYDFNTSLDLMTDLYQSLIKNTDRVSVPIAATHFPSKEPAL